MNIAPHTFAQSLTAPLDAARSRALRALGSAGRPFLVDREARVALYGAVGIGVAFAATVLAPLWLLAFGPIVLGVPHLLADARYLVARQGLHRRLGFWAFIAAPLVLTFVHPQATTALAAVGGAAILARGATWRRALVFAAAAAAALVASRFGRTADLVMAHLHNVVALALWWYWAPRRGGKSYLVLALFTLFAAAILSGALDHASSFGAGAPGVTLREMVRTLAPSASGAYCLRIVLFFAFAQSVHYAAWLRLIPEEDRPRAGLRSFASSLAALRCDVGSLLVVVACVATLGVWVWGLGSPHAARLGYLRVALFHGPLEIAVAALLFIERRPLKGASGC